MPPSQPIDSSNFILCKLKAIHSDSPKWQMLLDFLYTKVHKNLCTNKNNNIFSRRSRQVLSDP